MKIFRITRYRRDRWWRTILLQRKLHWLNGKQVGLRTKFYHYLSEKEKQP